MAKDDNMNNIPTIAIKLTSLTFPALLRNLTNVYNDVNKFFKKLNKTNDCSID